MKQGKPYDARVSEELLMMFKEWIDKHFNQNVYKKFVLFMQKDF